jgi:hypothetical protein
MTLTSDAFLRGEAGKLVILAGELRSNPECEVSVSPRYETLFFPDVVRPSPALNRTGRYVPSCLSTSARPAG